MRIINPGAQLLQYYVKGNTAHRPSHQGSQIDGGGDGCVREPPAPLREDHPGSPDHLAPCIRTPSAHLRQVVYE